MKKTLFTLITLINFACAVYAQPGALDPTFMGLTDTAAGLGPNFPVYSSALKKQDCPTKY